jgi:hypothetical protein
MVAKLKAELYRLKKQVKDDDQFAVPSSDLRPYPHLTPSTSPP